MKKGDLIVIIIIAVFMAIVGIGYLIYLNSVGEHRVVNIYIDKKLYQSIPLTKDTEMEILIDNEYGYNLVKIYNNGVQVLEADCHEQVDVKKGFVNNPGIPIICLPHKLVIMIEGEESKSDDIAGG